MGNRGCIHVGHDIVRQWNGKRWITCALEYKGWRAPRWDPGRWTALFFHDEAVALAAGHRPCALCRRTRLSSGIEDAWKKAFGTPDGAEEIDDRLHRDRLDGRSKRLHSMPWPEVPDGAFVDLGGVPCRVDAEAMRPWTAGIAYGESMPRGPHGHGDGHHAGRERRGVASRLPARADRGQPCGICDMNWFRSK